MSTLATTNLKNPSSGSNNIVLATDGATTLTTAKITTLADSAGANTSTPEEIASGRAKAWVNFDGTGTVAIRASYNVSSITDNGVGDYTVNFTTAMPDANYSTLGVTNEAVLNNRSSGWCIKGTDSSFMLTTSVRINVGSQSSGGAGDQSVVTVSVFR